MWSSSTSSCVASARPRRQEAGAETRPRLVDGDVGVARHRQDEALRLAVFGEAGRCPSGPRRAGGESALPGRCGRSAPIPARRHRTARAWPRSVPSPPGRPLPTARLGAARTRHRAAGLGGADPRPADLRADPDPGLERVLLPHLLPTMSLTMRGMLASPARASPLCVRSARTVIRSPTSNTSCRRWEM